MNRRTFCQIALLLPLGAYAKPKRAQPRIAIALGGGAAKGFAHIGVLKALQQAKLPIHLVVGTSAGAIAGCLYASGMPIAQLEREADMLNHAELFDLTLAPDGFIKGEKLQNWINQKVNHRPIQDFPIPFASVATDRDRLQRLIITQGDAGRAVRASAAVPQVFQAVRIDGHDYVDGGVTDPVPVSAAQALGANFVIAVDISARPAGVGKDGNWLNYLDQSLNILNPVALKRELALADVVIRPQVQELGAVVGGFEQKALAIQLGQQATQQALPEIKRKLRKLGMKG